MAQKKNQKLVPNTKRKEEEKEVYNPKTKHISYRSRKSSQQKHSIGQNQARDGNLDRTDGYPNR